MKKILTTLAIIAALAIFGCSDFLEETPYSQISEQEAYSTPTLVYINTVASLYLETGNIGFFGDDQGFAYGYYFRNQEFSADLERRRVIEREQGAHLFGIYDDGEIFEEGVN